MPHPSLQPVLSVLGDIAPTFLAASWDNVGLLLEGTRPVRRIGLCIDLTEVVLDEMVSADIDLVLAYHPLIFKGPRRLTEGNALGRTVLSLVRSGMHLYSPHTALDAVPGGMNDWLLRGFGSTKEVVPITADPRDPTAGIGRLATVSRPRGCTTTVRGLCEHLDLAHVRVAAGPRWSSPKARVRRVAVCPGAGGSAFETVRHADLFLTGEMRHHDVLARVAQGSVVVLTDHTNTERGYLPLLASQLEARLADIEVQVSQVDADPLVVVSR